MNPEMDSAQARLVDALSAQPVFEGGARAAFREDLRRCFSSGDFSALLSARTQSVLPGLSSEPQAAGEMEFAAPMSNVASAAERTAWNTGEYEAGAGHHGHFRPRLLRALVAAAAAALVLAIWLPRGSRWSLRVLDDVAFLPPSPSQTAGVGEPENFERFQGDVDALLESGLIRTGSHRLQMTLPGKLIVELTPHTVADLSGLRNEARAGTRGFRLEKGEAYIKKAKGARDQPLLIVTQDAQVEVLGTTLGVQCIEAYTCVCVAEGEVRVSPMAERHAPVGEVSGGNSLLVMRHGPTPEIRRPFPKTLCPNPVPHDHHVCALLNFQARVTDER